MYALVVHGTGGGFDTSANCGIPDVFGLANNNVVWKVLQQMKRQFLLLYV